MVVGGFRWFKVVLGGFRSFLLLVTTILKTLTGYRPYSHSENRNFSSPLIKK